MKVLCIESISENGYFNFNKGTYYTVNYTYKVEGQSFDCYAVEDENEFNQHFSEDIFRSYFITLKELRKLKLERIGNV